MKQCKATGAKRTGRTRIPLRRQGTGYAFILPWLVALACFIGYPFLAGFYFSFCDFPPLRTPMFVGTQNYTELLGDPAFHRSLGVTMVYASVAIPLGVMLALTLSMLLNSRIRGQSFYRVIFYLPHLVPTVAVAILWMWILNPKFGLFNSILKLLFGVLNAWTGLFFNIAAALDGHNFLRPEALVLLAAPLLLGVLVFAKDRRKLLADTTQPKTSPRLRRFLKALAVAGTALGAIAVINVLLSWLLPVDMRKLQSPGWLGDGTPMPSVLSFAPSWALWSLVVMSMWGVGQMAVIYLAKLQDVPVELYEAADIDGASWWRKTLHITLPMISPVILFNVVMAIIGTFQIFAEPYIMTGGGPEQKTRFMAMFIYDQAFLYQRVGYASAVAWVLFLVIVGLTVLAFRASRKHVYYAGR
ncbi:MAG TPA: sugar ABC transporter permease [Planctomycetota bacterium]|nr:sugar ABC transporter permease [Planctomycetota bacterium]